VKYTWQATKTYLEVGTEVIVVEFGDDYGRQGVVAGRVNDLAEVNFGYKSEFYHVSKLNVWAKAPDYS
jgi:hypothetical protein